jgi:tetratricopeptide (TPR) repeat protein
VSSRGTRIAAVALAAAALAPWPPAAAPADPLAQADREAAAAEERLLAAERHGVPDDEPPAVRAQRRFEDGDRQYFLGDWLHAAVLLTDAVDEPAWQEAPDRPAALFRLGDALRRDGSCGAARVRLAEYLALGHAEYRPTALSGALECAVKERRQADVDRLLAEAERAFAGELPAEIRYLAAKSTFQRTDLAPAERVARAAAAFEQVGPPFQLQAWYFLGVLEIERQELHASLQWFESCARAEPQDERDVAVRDLCLLALGRMHAQMGDPAAAVAWYAAVPAESASSAEALHEQAWAHVRAKQFEQALRMASFVPELAPESPLAPEATLLRGHLLLRLGRYVEATEAYNAVINAYAPVRDEIDAILATKEDPLRYFDELVGRQDGDATSVLPQVAVRWATASPEVAVALQLVRALEEARRDVREARDLADRLDTLLQRGGGLDAFPALQRGHAQAQAAENAAARAEASYVAALGAVAARALPADKRGNLQRAREARRAVEARFDRLPRGPEQVDERLARMRGRIDGVDAEAFRLGLVLDGCEAAIAGSEAYLEQHRAQVASDAEGPAEFTDELRKHRDIILGYEEELAAVRQELAKVRDVAGGVEALVEESRIRAELLEAVERERLLAEEARGSVPPPERALFERADAARARLATVRSRARALELEVVADATRRAGELRGHIGEEKLALARQGGTLEGVQAVAKQLLGGIAVRSIAEVRAQFYRLVLKADVGIVDVAWSRKRQRLDKIHQLAVQKDAEVEQLDREYRAVLREVD